MQAASNSESSPLFVGTWGQSKPECVVGAIHELPLPFNRGNTDLTSTSLRGIFRRGTLVVPGDRQWKIERLMADVTSTSLRGKTDLTSRSLRAKSYVSQDVFEVHPLSRSGNTVGQVSAAAILAEVQERKKCVPFRRHPKGRIVGPTQDCRKNRPQKSLLNYVPNSARRRVSCCWSRWTIALCIWLTRLSERSSVAPISFMVNSS